MRTGMVHHILNDILYGGSHEGGSRERESSSAKTVSEDPILKVLRGQEGVEYQKFLNLHAGCQGYNYGDPVASCSTHGVISASRPDGYIYK